MTWKWTKERIEQVRKWVEEGKSSGWIAAEFGEDCTRNAVVGIRHREKIETNPSVTIQHKARLPRTAAPRRPAVPAPLGTHRGMPPLPPVVPPRVQGGTDAYGGQTGEGPVGFMELRRGMCRYPVGEGPEYKFCGASASGSYCSFHHKLCNDGKRHKKKRRT